MKNLFFYLNNGRLYQAAGIQFGTSYVEGVLHIRPGFDGGVAVDMSRGSFYLGVSCLWLAINIRIPLPFGP